MTRSAAELNEALGLVDSSDDTESGTGTDTDTESGTGERPEYHCLVDGCDAHFPEQKQAEKHVIEDHSFINIVESLIVEKPVRDGERNPNSA